jgi:hypothetical protein
MKNLESTVKKELSFQDAKELALIGATSGAAIAKITGTKESLGAIIGGGLALLIGGIIASID